jgi:hypothetical protein
MSLLLALLLQVPALTPVSTMGGPYFGDALVRVPDQDHDGRDDLAIGALPMFDGWGRCAVAYVYSTHDFSLLATLRGSSCDAHSRAALSATPIWPRGALVLGLPRGGCEVVSLHDGCSRWRHDAPDYGLFARGEVATVGDVDADGVDDFALAASCAADCRARVRLCSGLTGRVLWESEPSFEFTEFVALATLFDCTSDGVSEVVFVTGRSGLGGSPRGSPRIQMLSGRDGRVLVEREHALSCCDWRPMCAPVADASGDLVPDLLLGVEGSGATPGWVELLSGATLEPISRVTGRAGEGAFGQSVAVSRLGPPARWAVASHADLFRADLGAVVLFEGASGEPKARVEGEHAELGFCSGVVFLPDLDGDGWEELAASSLYPDYQPGSVGSVKILDGRTLHVIRELEPPEP